jgi:hypothetical protein
MAHFLVFSKNDIWPTQKEIGGLRVENLSCSPPNWILNDQTMMSKKSKDKIPSLGARSYMDLIFYKSVHIF